MPDDPWGERTDGDDEAERDELEAEILRADRPIEEDLPGADAEEAVSLVDGGIADTEDELVGEAADGRDAFASPEEAAMSIRDRASGATDHEDPHGAGDAPDEDEA